jgi:hypothetical protein
VGPLRGRHATEINTAFREPKSASALSSQGERGREATVQSEPLEQETRRKQASGASRSTEKFTTQKQRR